MKLNWMLLLTAWLIAATAAAQAIEAGVAVQDVEYATLRERLLADKQRF